MAVDYGQVLLESQGTAGYSISVLFLLFLGISVGWEIAVGLLTWAVTNWGTPALGAEVWLERLKDELLSLGVISLILAFVKTPLTHICVKVSGAQQVRSQQRVEDFNDLAGRRLLSDLPWTHPVPRPKHSPPGRHLLAEAAVQEFACPAGHDQLFTKSVIDAAHYVLFYLAVVQLLYSLLSMLFTSYRMRQLADWERRLRAGTAVRAASPADPAMHPASAATSTRSVSGPARFGWLSRLSPSAGRAQQMELQTVTTVAPADQGPGSLAEGQTAAGALRSNQGQQQLTSRQHTQQGACWGCLYACNSDSDTDSNSDDDAKPSGARGFGRSRGSKQPAAPLLGSWQAWWSTWLGGISPYAYDSMRAALKLRAAHHGLQGTFRHLNLATAAAQAVQQELSTVASHAWVQTLLLALMLLYPLVVYQILWAAGVAFLLTLLLALHMAWLLRHVSMQLDTYAAHPASVGVPRALHRPHTPAAVHQDPGNRTILAQKHTGVRSNAQDASDYSVVSVPAVDATTSALDRFTQLSGVTHNPTFVSRASKAPRLQTVTSGIHSDLDPTVFTRPHHASDYSNPAGLSRLSEPLHSHSVPSKALSEPDGSFARHSSGSAGLQRASVGQVGPLTRHSMAASSQGVRRAEDERGQQPLSRPSVAAASVAQPVLDTAEQHAQLAVLESSMQKVFWLSWPQGLLYVVSASAALNALSITVCFYFLITAVPAEGVSGLAVWLPLLALDLVTALVLGYVVVPQYALLVTVVGFKPSKLAALLQQAAQAGAEEEHQLQGISGLVVWALCHLQPHHRQANRHIKALTTTSFQPAALVVPASSSAPPLARPSVAGTLATTSQAAAPGLAASSITLTNAAELSVSGAGTVTTGREPVAEALVAMLAERAGVVLPASLAREAPHAVLQAALVPHMPLLAAVVLHWQQAAGALQAQAAESDAAPLPPLALSTHPDPQVRESWAQVQAAFKTLDIDQSGSVSSKEVMTYAARVMGLRLSTPDLDALMHEAGTQPGRRLDCVGFLLALTFSWLDTHHTGLMIADNLSTVWPTVAGANVVLEQTSVEAMLRMCASSSTDLVNQAQFSKAVNPLLLEQGAQAMVHMCAPDSSEVMTQVQLSQALGTHLLE